MLQAIAQGVEAEITEHLDLTAPQIREMKIGPVQDDLAVIGVPVYGGRVPPEALVRLRKIKGDDTPAIVVVLYGNREFEDALLELKELVSQTGFIPIAGAAFIGEHSFATADLPIAAGRPDIEDIEKAKGFGKKVRAKLAHGKTPLSHRYLGIPGNSPYKQRGKRDTVSPLSIEDLCTLCGECGECCPTGAITVEDMVVTHSSACILCCACIKNCPSDSRIMDDPGIKKIAEWLNAKCSDRKEPEIFM